MSEWGFWDWIGFSSLTIAALVIAADAAIAQSDELKKYFPRPLKIPFVAYLPIFAILVAIVAFAIKKFAVSSSLWPKWGFFWSFFLIAMGALQSNPKWKSMLALFGMLIGIAFFGTSAKVYFWPSEQSVVNVVIPINFASISFYEHSTVIWTSEPDRGYYILPERNPGTWTFKSELRWVAMTPQERRAAFARYGIFPKDWHDPYGGFATYLINNPAEWENAGWLINLCQINGGAVSYKEFPGGFEIGPFPAGVSTRAANTYKFYSDGNKVVSSRLSDNAAPACSPVSDLFYSAPTSPPAAPLPSPVPPQPPAGTSPQTFP